MNNITKRWAHRRRKTLRVGPLNLVNLCKKKFPTSVNFRQVLGARRPPGHTMMTCYITIIWELMPADGTAN